MPEDVQQPVDEVKKAEEIAAAEEAARTYQIKLDNDKVVYTSNPQEFDDCFYATIALSSWSKTFTPKNDLSLTFSTITNEENLELLKKLQEWSKLENASGGMFESFMTKINLAYFLTVLSVQGSTINLREKPVEDRMAYFGKQPEAVLNFYGMYNFIFNEIVRKSLVEPLALKNS